MRLLLPALFLIVPLIEIALFVTIGGQIGVLATMALVVLTALLGTILLRWQGFAVLSQARLALDQGRLPIGAVADGVFLLAAGLLLLTPGFFTDALGFLLFVPGIRRAIGQFLLRQFLAMQPDPAQPGRPGAQRRGPIIIEGEVIARDDAPPDKEPRRS